MFTNAMLNTPDITALIRDTEAHERALFSLGPTDPYAGTRGNTENPSRRSTIFNTQREAIGEEGNFRPPRRGTAVATVLGGDMSERIRREYGRDAKDSRLEVQREKDDIDVELLLRGAEKLCAVYPIQGALERIAALRNRNAKVQIETERYEQLVAEQAAQLRSMNKQATFNVDDDEIDDLASREAVAAAPEPLQVESIPLTDEDLRREEESIAELERKKRTLEERVNGMEKDLGGLLR